MTSDRYTAYTQPVLQQEFVNEDRLADVLGDSDGWAAVVATSKRAGEAWANAIRSRKAAKSGTGSEDTGCAENLGPFIVSHNDSGARPKSNAATSNPFLVLTGDKNSSELTDHLQRHQVVYEELEVYRTSPRSDIAQRLAELLEAIVVGSNRGVDQAITIWFAFFSPSSAEAVLHAETLTTTAEQKYWYNHVASELEQHYRVRIRFRMAAIGKTTGNYLRRQGFGDVVQAVKPNAEGMAKAIAEGQFEKMQL
ncbi:hypothetical protein QFC20_000344 [Naganishia adeliensis]|uniref:Uncharacterized protein n=1 Tax=Naganishia adeliensis TaxID=92952 RepID=A0ACC2X0W1_9TREE|nr:hypothetical protein QFC20_000344 [Naganishia adeliensis]